MPTQTTAPLVTADQGTGVIERVLYGVILGLCMKLVKSGWLDADMAPYFAAGIVSAAGGVYAFWVNRPKAIVQSANALANVQGVITTNTAEGRELAKSIPEGTVVSAGTSAAVDIAQSIPPISPAKAA